MVLSGRARESCVLLLSLLVVPSCCSLVLLSSLSTHPHLCVNAWPRTVALSGSVCPAWPLVWVCPDCPRWRLFYHRALSPAWPRVPLLNHLVRVYVCVAMNATLISSDFLVTYPSVFARVTRESGTVFFQTRFNLFVYMLLQYGNIQ